MNCPICNTKMYVKDTFVNGENMTYRRLHCGECDELYYSVEEIAAYEPKFASVFTQKADRSRQKRSDTERLFKEYSCCVFFEATKIGKRTYVKCNQCHDLTTVQKCDKCKNFVKKRG